MSNYNGLGSIGFRDLCHALLREVLGPTYRPYSALGADGQRDGTFDGVPLLAGLPSGYWVVQFKHHDVENVGAGRCRTMFLQEVKEELCRWQSTGARRPDVLLFVTNLVATGVDVLGTFDKFDRHVATIGAPGPDCKVLLWDRPKLDLELVPFPKIRVASGMSLSLADLFTGLAGLAIDVAKGMEREHHDDAIDLNLGALYVRDWGAVVLVGDVGNPTARMLTVSGIEIAVENLETLRPCEVVDGKGVPGASWQSAGVTEGIPPDGIRRWAWFLPVADPGLRRRLEAEPASAVVTLRLYPPREQRLSITIQPPPKRSRQTAEG